MDNHAGWFVNHDDGMIFIQDREGEGFGLQRKGFGFGKRPRDQVSRFDMGAGFGFLVIEKDRSFFNQFFGPRTREMEVGFREELIDPSSLAFQRYLNREIFALIE
jgi:hypothetical protein